MTVYVPQHCPTGSQDVQIGGSGGGVIGESGPAPVSGVVLGQQVCTPASFVQHEGLLVKRPGEFESSQQGEWVTYERSLQQYGSNSTVTG